MLFMKGKKYMWKLGKTLYIKTFYSFLKFVENSDSLKKKWDLFETNVVIIFIDHLFFTNVQYAMSWKVFRPNYM